MSKGEVYPYFSKSSLYPPSNLSYPPFGKTPEYDFKTEHIFGCSCKGSKGDIIHLNKDNELVYPAAACGVVLNVKTQKQKIFKGHIDDIVCISMHPNKKYVATGETGKDDKILVWDSITMKKLKELQTCQFFKGGGVIACSFSPNGKLLAAVGGQQLNSILIVYDWEKGVVVAKGKGHTGKVFALDWHNEDTIVLCGKNALKYNVIDENIIIQKNAILSPIGKIQNFYCSYFNKNTKGYIGTRSGEIYKFRDNKIISNKKFSKLGIYCIEKYSDETGEGFFIGCKDGNLKKVTKKLKEELTIDLNSGVRSVVPLNSKIVYCFLKNGKFMEVNIEDEQNPKIKIVGRSHYGKGELWAIDTIPNTNICVTGGDDGQVIFWDLKNKNSIHDFSIKGDVRSISVHPNGSYLALGSGKGTVKVYDLKKVLENGEEGVVFSKRVANGEISVIRYSPNGDYLAVGGHDNKIYIFDIENNGYNKPDILDSHNSFISQMDWSKDSSYLRSICGGYEVLFWSIGKGKRITSTQDMSDIDWATDTLKIGYNTMGIWDMSKYNDGSDINNLYTDFKKNIVAVANDLGTIEVFCYPVRKNSKSISIIGHCSHITNVKIHNDMILTVGGQDLTLQINRME